MKNEELKKNKTTEKGKTSKAKDTKKSSTQKKEIEKNTTKKKTTNKEKNVKTVKVEKVAADEVVVKQNTDKSKTNIKKEASSNKKSDIFLIVGLVVVVVLGFLMMRDKNTGPSYELPLTLTGEAGLHQLTYAEYQEKIDNNEEFVIILERATCSHCVAFMPVAEQFATDNGVPMYYVDTDTFTEEDWEGFEKSNSYLKKANGNWGTPTTVVLAGYDTVDYIEGETSADSLLELYNKYFKMEE